MTPSLFGRWQTRLLLFSTVGVIVTAPFALGWIIPGASSIYFGVLFWIALLGLGWDILYHFLLKFRWDRDWPAIFQLIAGLWEAVFLFTLTQIIPLPGIGRELHLDTFALHYSLIWLAIFTVSQSFMRIWFLRWRFRGGRWL